MNKSNEQLQQELAEAQALIARIWDEVDPCTSSDSALSWDLTPIVRNYIHRMWKQRRAGKDKSP